ncbi:unnamed protein product, partial [Brassica rapa subsp. trilocularis]
IPPLQVLKDSQEEFQEKSLERSVFETILQNNQVIYLLRYSVLDLMINSVKNSCSGK